MTAPLIDPRELDHPDHFDDAIRNFRSSERYIPSALAQQLYEMAGHRCTICEAPWLELHHIDELHGVGKTEYVNLIVLCPNCHTRVHQEGVPTKTELRHYKLKQEVAYKLPVLHRLSQDEKQLLKVLGELPAEQRPTYLIRYLNPGLAEKNGNVQPDYSYLLSSGILVFHPGTSVLNGHGTELQVGGGIGLSPAGLRWIDYLCQAGRLPE